MVHLSGLFLSTLLITLGLGAAEVAPFEGMIRARLRRTKPDSAASPPGPEDVGLYQRKTQSPLIWLKYQKTELPKAGAAWFNTPFKDFARQAAGSMSAGTASAFSEKETSAESPRGLVVEAGTQGLRGASLKSKASPSEGAATLLMDAEMMMDHMSSLKNDVQKLGSRVSAGGRKAKKALMRLIDLWSEPNAKPLMLFSGLLFKCKKLMSSPETPDDTRALAGSLITLLTDVPVTSESSDEKSGSYGHVNIVVPRPSRVYRADKEILELEGGAAPADTEEGAYLR